jgi:hypothetical protein
MSNNEDMEVDVDRGHEQQRTYENIEGYEVRGNKAGSRGVNEKEREQLQREKGEKPDQQNKHSRQSNDENKEDWIPVGSNNKQNKRKDDMAKDGMTSYHIKTGVIEVRFMKIGDKGFNIAKSLKEFIAAARESDKEFSIMPINNEGDNLCRETKCTEHLGRHRKISQARYQVQQHQRLHADQDINGHLKTKTGWISIPHVSSGKESLYK